MSKNAAKITSGNFSISIFIIIKLEIYLIFDWIFDSLFHLIFTEPRTRRWARCARRSCGPPWRRTSPRTAAAAVRFRRHWPAVCFFFFDGEDIPKGERMWKRRRTRNRRLKEKSRRKKKTKKIVSLATRFSFTCVLFRFSKHSLFRKMKIDKKKNSSRYTKLRRFSFRTSRMFSKFAWMLWA